MIEVRRRLVPTDRLMVLAPHPDDESVATGGVLQAAVSMGAEVRIAYLTDGENNPWAQRATELRWRISECDRVRWGARRRREALEALKCLGVAPSSARFLGFPDQRVTETLLSQTHAAVERLADELAGWQPTVLFMPSLEDRHPDHGATAVMARLAMARARWNVRPRVFQYVVHARPAAGSGPWDSMCTLSESEREAKRKAILRHGSQLRLRRSFLLRFAEEEETFASGLSAPAVDHAAHPLQVLRTRGGQWSFNVRRTRHVALDRPSLLLISQGDEGMSSLRVPLPRRDGRCALKGPEGGDEVGEVEARRDGAWLTVTITSPALGHSHFRLAKLDLPLRRGIGLFDSWPWLSFGALRAPAAAVSSELGVASAAEPLVSMAES